MIVPNDMAVYFIEKMEKAETVEQLDLVASDIKEWRDLLACYYVSNKTRITQTGQPSDILKKGVL